MSDTVLLAEEHVGLIISRDGDPVSLYRTFPLVCLPTRLQTDTPPNKFKERGNQPALRAQQGALQRYITACSPAQHLSVLWKVLNTSHFICTQTCLMMGSEKKQKKQIYCCHQTASILLQMIKRSNRHSKKTRFQLFDRLLAFNIVYISVYGAQELRYML